MKISNSILCPICHIKRGRQFNHARCSKILQKQNQDIKHKKAKKLRESDADYLATL